MGIISIDLGTTNIKAAAYTDSAEQLAIFNHPVTYQRKNAAVEFDPNAYFDSILDLLSQCSKTVVSNNEPVQIVLTGQAESLVLLDADGAPLRPGISWLDMRSEAECQELSHIFPRSVSYPITGQPEIIPTWPLTKLLWIRRHEPNVFSNIAHILLLKDYILYRLTGRFCGEYSIYGFSHYFDIQRKCYWEDILHYCGIQQSQLPELVPPCSVIGNIFPEVLRITQLPEGSYANAGTLDHFSGMLGTGNLAEGNISESAGTVSSIATFVHAPDMSATRLPVYCGPFQDSYIYLPVCESGGISLEWFRKQFLDACDYDLLNQSATVRSFNNELLFLPYITGVNPPDFDPNASGVFFGIRASHDKYDFALAAMAGVAFLLRKNIEYFRANGIPVQQIITTGGGSRSALWCQIKADICGLPVIVPSNEEAPCLGAAMIGAVQNGSYPDFQSAVNKLVDMKRTYLPRQDRQAYEEKYALFLDVYSALQPVYAKAATLTALHPTI